MKGEDLEVCTFKYCSNEWKKEEVLEGIKYAGKLSHLIREIFWDCMFVCLNVAITVTWTWTRSDVPNTGSSLNEM